MPRLIVTSLIDTTPFSSMLIAMTSLCAERPRSTIGRRTFPDRKERTVSRVKITSNCHTTKLRIEILEFEKCWWNISVINKCLCIVYTMAAPLFVQQGEMTSVFELRKGSGWVGQTKGFWGTHAELGPVVGLRKIAQSAPPTPSYNSHTGWPTCV